VFVYCVWLYRFIELCIFLYYSILFVSTLAKILAGKTTLIISNVSHAQTRLKSYLIQGFHFAYFRRAAFSTFLVISIFSYNVLFDESAIKSQSINLPDNMSV